jgi:hypothetical protein
VGFQNSDRARATERTGREWDTACREAQRQLLRAVLLGGERAVRPAGGLADAQVTISHTVTMGARHPAGAQCTAGEPESWDGAAVAGARQAHRAGRGRGREHHRMPFGTAPADLRARSFPGWGRWARRSRTAAVLWRQPEEWPRSGSSATPRHCSAATPARLSRCEHPPLPERPVGDEPKVLRQHDRYPC